MGCVEWMAVNVACGVIEWNESYILFGEVGKLVVSCWGWVVCLASGLKVEWFGC